MNSTRIVSASDIELFSREEEQSLQGHQTTSTSIARHSNSRYTKRIGSCVADIEVSPKEEEQSLQRHQVTTNLNTRSSSSRDTTRMGSYVSAKSPRRSREAPDDSIPTNAAEVRRTLRENSSKTTDSNPAVHKEKKDASTNKMDKHNESIQGRPERRRCSKSDMSTSTKRAITNESAK